ncbi:MAG TPA: response regulator transcription factor [Acidimicrobiales bacterium]|nr:response regulator transcription factor [Acidimicrobiales bacterium]
MVVDDLEDMRLMLRLRLTMSGIDVVAEAADGRQAIEVARDVRPDGILLDVMMPVMSGLDALPTLRQSLPEARIVLYTAGDVSALHEAAEEGGATALLSKSVGPDALIAVLRNGGA